MVVDDHRSDVLSICKRRSTSASLVNRNDEMCSVLINFRPLTFCMNVGPFTDEMGEDEIGRMTKLNQGMINNLRSGKSVCIFVGKKKGLGFFL